VLEALAPPPFVSIKELHERLCERIAAIHPLVVGDVLRAFVDVSSLPCELTLWSLEFAFDEDDSRIARFEARFVKHGEPLRPSEEQAGYEVNVHLPRVLPPRPPGGGDGHAKLQAPADATPGSLVTRFLTALDELGAYRTIERLEVNAAEVYLL
jgi:hypothetical protein